MTDLDFIIVIVSGFILFKMESGYVSREVSPSRHNQFTGTAIASDNINKSGDTALVILFASKWLEATFGNKPLRRIIIQ